MAWTFSQKTTFTGFTTVAEEAQILTLLQTAYDRSSTAKTMFDNWINAGNTIEIRFRRDTFQAAIGRGIVIIDPSYISDVSYINDTGKAVPYSLLGALLHELGHALTGKQDNGSSTDYQGDNVRYVNQIWSELGLDKQISYIGQAKGNLHRVGKVCLSPALAPQSNRRVCFSHRFFSLFAKVCHNFKKMV
ncbi:MAG: hypothetical protein EAZ28_31960 [Oscillatoriales cyanobacterium]|nr:MAG: hypothetical protein EAZ28_31960 [Oscillatoriales cyanobacterium]